MPPKCHRIAVILPLELELSGRLLEGAVNYAKSRRWVNLVELPYRGNAPNSFRLSDPLPFDAALVGATRKARWMKTLIASKVPLVSASGDWSGGTVPSICFSGRGIVRSAFEYLARLAPASLAHIEFVFDGNPLAEGRQRVFREMADERGMRAVKHQIFASGDWADSALARRSPLPADAAARLEDFLRDLPRPAGIWCNDDMLAMRVCEAAEGLGLRIPADFAVLGVGDLRGAASCRPPLSTIPLPAEILGYRAFEALDRCLWGETRVPEQLSIGPPPVIERESTVDLRGLDPVSKALSLISEGAASGMTAREVAAAVRVSPQTLHARFVERIGRTPGEEIRRVRLANAKCLLADPRLSISEVAQRCGFEQQSKFSNFFRRETGMSPRGFRQVQKS
jgi:LacI family transcriptional regulator